MSKPIAKYILLSAIIEEVKTSSGLVLSGDDMSAMRYHKAEVLAVGDEIDKVKKGDIVLFDKTNSFSMILEQKTVTICSYRDIVLVF